MDRPRERSGRHRDGGFRRAADHHSPMFDVRLDDADPETETGPLQGLVRLP